MKGFLRSTKFKVIFVPLVILSVFSSLLMANVLKQEQNPPSKGWSRAIYLDTTLRSESQPFVNYEKHLYQIYTVASNKEVKRATLNSKMEQVGSKTYKVSIPIWSSFWTDGKTFLFIKNGSLVKSLNGKIKVVLPHVSGLVAQEKDVVLWRKNQIMRYIPSTEKIVSITQCPYPIDQVFSENGTGTLLVQSTNIDNKHVYIGVLESKDGYMYHPIDTIQATSDIAVGDFDFLIKDNVMKVAYMEYLSTSGHMARKNFLTTYDLSTFKKKAVTEPLNIINDETQLAFTAPTHLKIRDIHNQVTLLFQETGPFSRGVEAQNIFLAKRNQEKKQWTAIPVSSTLEPSADPVWLNDQTILWNDLNNGNYQLLLASQYPNIVQKGSHLIQKDWSNALSRTLINLSISLLILVYALLWACPTVIFIIVMFFGNMTLMEKNPIWVRVVGVLLYLVTQIIMVQQLFGPLFSMYAPHYLLFPGNSFVIPIFLGGLAWLLANYVKNEEWGNTKFIFYCLLLDAFMLGFLIGPYTL